MNYKVLLFLLLPLVSFGQEEIIFDYHRDYPVILAKTAVDTAEMSFDKLFPRFVKGDTSLSNYEMIALQIGYTKNDNYWPYDGVKLEGEVEKLLHGESSDELLAKCDTLLKLNPFSLMGNLGKGVAYIKGSIADSAAQYLNRFFLVALSDLSTGDGKSFENSIFVLSPKDGQYLIRYLFQTEICFMGSDFDDKGKFYDILGVPKQEEGDCVHLYFNIDHAARRMFGPEGLKIDD